MKQTATAEDYAAAFEKERQNTYPLIDAFEQRMGYAIDRERLEGAARVLACPVKNNDPNWQHGRVLYAAARRYFGVHGYGWQLAETWTMPEGPDGPPGVPYGGPFVVLDIGTAKGFSALCLWSALNDSGAAGIVTSLDVIDPHERVRRNTVVEVNGHKTLFETLDPWPEASHIRFLQSTGIDYLRTHHERLHVVFVDGKHTADVVKQEAQLIAAKQEPGDLCIFDDVHLPEIRAVVRSFSHSYALEYLDILPNRGYAVGVRK